MFCDERLLNYLREHSVREHPVLRECRLATQALPDHRKQIKPELGQLFQFLFALTQPLEVLELGTFTGYSTLSFALASPPDAQIITCDIKDTYVKKAEVFWQQAGVAHKIDARIMKGLDCMDLLIASGRSTSFDFIFIDADKQSSLNYYEHALTLIKPSGIIAIDDTLWHGNVLDETFNDKYTQGIRDVNNFAQQDPRVTLCMLPIDNGVTLLKRR